MKNFAVIKISAGYIVKSFNTEAEAREFAAKCGASYHNFKNYMVCERINGVLTEIDTY